MLTTLTIYQPDYGPQGQPYTVRITGTGDTINVPCWTENEAWTIRDAAIDEGHLVRILGLPIRGVTVVPDVLPTLPVISD